MERTKNNDQTYKGEAMNLPTDPANPWSEAKVYTFGDVEVIVLKAKSYEPVRYYTEIHRHGLYIMSLGSRALTRWGAVFAALWHDCPKEELGYRCKHTKGECSNSGNDKEEV